MLDDCDDPMFATLFVSFFGIYFALHGHCLDVGTVGAGTWILLPS